MIANPLIMKSVEQLNYRVTDGDVAAQAGLKLEMAQQGLLALASDAGGHLQVADTGEIVFLFPKNFRNILRNKFWRIRLQEWWAKVWQFIFYLIRISFGILLIVSIILMMIAIAVIIIAISSRDGDNNSGGGGSRNSRGGGLIFFPRFWIGDLFWFFDFNPHPRRYQKQRTDSESEMNFLEAVFSFLFGDGDPNFNLEERRWNKIGTVIRNHGGAVVAEQIAPYLDDVSKEDEDYMIPVLSKFNGYPQVSPDGEIIYYFPELQVSAKQYQTQSVSSYLQQHLWRFSQAGSGQIILSIGLGAANFILALVLGSLLQGDVVSQLGGLVAFVDSIYWLLLGYGTAFLSIPLIRYFWIQRKNVKIQQQNQQRQESAQKLNELNSKLDAKIAYAQQFSAQKVIGDRDITYSTEQDLLDQEIERADKIDAEWRKRLESN